MVQNSEAAASAPWYRVRLSRADYENGELAVLRGAFRACYFARNGPRGMAMLGEFETGGQGAYSVYFTPVAGPHVQALVRAYSAVAEGPPPRRGLDLIEGDPAGAWLAVREF